MEEYTFKLEADSYKNLSKHTKVINANTTEYFLWVHIPEELSLDYNIYQVDELRKCRLKEVEINNYIEREPCRPWIKITFKILNSEVGQHIYRISLINKHTDDVISLYFSYIMQSDNPDKPYIYMNRKGCCQSTKPCCGGINRIDY